MNTNRARLHRRFLVIFDDIVLEASFFVPHVTTVMQYLLFRQIQRLQLQWTHVFFVKLNRINKTDNNSSPETADGLHVRCGKQKKKK